jgi:hypothetical protein
MTMTEEERVVEPGQAEMPEAEPVIEEIKVQAQDLFKALNDLIREGTARRVTIIRNDRVLVDIPLAVGVAASVVLAIYLPIISALAAVGALFSGCTLRIERDAPEPED